MHRERVLVGGMQPVLDLAVMDGMVEDGVVALELEVDAPLEVPSVRGERDAEGNPDEARLGEVPRTFDEDVDVLAVGMSRWAPVARRGGRWRRCSALGSRRGRGGTRRIHIGRTAGRGGPSALEAVGLEQLVLSSGEKDAVIGGDGEASGGEPPGGGAELKHAAAQAGAPDSTSTG